MAILGAQKFTVIRHAPGSYVNGDWVEGTQSTFTITASLQPASGQELDLLPEGSRKRARHKMYQDSGPKLRTLDLADQTTPDIVCTDEGEFHVHVLGNYTRHQAPTAHTKYILIRRGVDA